VHIRGSVLPAQAGVKMALLALIIILRHGGGCLRPRRCQPSMQRACLPQESALNPMASPQREASLCIDWKRRR
jgi:hypothetical protein